jgi:hypothetical protein
MFQFFGQIYIVEKVAPLLSILGTPLFIASCEETCCNALNKPLDHCYHMHNMLNKCQHMDLLKSKGFWLDPIDQSKAYIVVDYLENALNSLEKEHVFHMQGEYICVFSEFGFKTFRYVKLRASNIV